MHDLYYEIETMNIAYSKFINSGILMEKIHIQGQNFRVLCYPSSTYK
jgi:hypothetical protein